MYDDNGKYIGFTYNGTEYYYVYNLQGDVVALANSTGTIIARYIYGPWGTVDAVTDNAGNDISADATHIANINPIRYRGYYYDAETGFYYLNSRYYDPEICRFINADSITDSGSGVLGYNIFIYASNNPVNNSDPSGHGIIKSAAKWFIKNVAKPVSKAVNKYWNKHVKGTTTIGITGMAAFGPAINGSIGLCYDKDGNVGLQLSAGGGGGTPSASAGVFRTKTNAPNVKKLKGKSMQAGGSADVCGASIGLEYTCFSDDETNELYQGCTAVAGIGAPIPAELHADISDTAVYSINIFELFEELYNEIME